MLSLGEQSRTGQGGDEHRLRVWHRYHRAFAELETLGVVRRPIVPARCEHNAHMYSLLLRDQFGRDGLIAGLRGRGVDAVFHYVPLHSSPAGLRVGRCSGSLDQTDRQSGRIVRLPLWAAMTAEIVDRVIGAVEDAITDTTPAAARFARPDPAVADRRVDAALELASLSR